MDELMDEKLGILTTGLRHWRKEEATLYNRMESTPYHHLDELFKHYTINKNDSLIDFGAGRGRVLFYTHYQHDIPVYGVELHDLTFDELEDNKKFYLKRSKSQSPVVLEYGYADSYEIDKDDTICFFFNPFCLSIFKGVVQNIIQSLKDYERQLDIILYYPEKSFKRYLEKNTPFKLYQVIRIPNKKDKRRKFVVYRYEPNESKVEESI